MQFQSAPKCAACKTSVYPAEKVTSHGVDWHKTCFKCQNCKKVLALGTASDHDNKPYCASCYSKCFGPKGYGYGVGAGVLTDTGVVSGKAKGKVSKKSQPPVGAVKSTYERKVKETSAAKKTTAAKKPGATAAKLKFGGAPKCKVCDKSVYEAEKVAALGNVFHKSCFKCGGCKKLLNLGDASDHKGMPFCKGCYGKNFGPKGFGFGNTLGDTGIGKKDFKA